MSKIITLTLNPSLDKTFNLDNFRKGKVNRADGYRIDAGGKGINVSRALSNFNTENTALGIIGGESGALLEKLLIKENVECDFLKVDGQTRTNYKIFDAASGDTTDINEPGIRMNPAQHDAFFEKYRTHLKNAGFAVLAGSIPPDTEPDIYKTLIEEAKKYGVKVILDAEGEKLGEGIKAQPFAIKPNIHEFEDLCGKSMKSQADILNGIREIQKSGIELVVVSMGGDGAIFMQGNIAYRTIAPKVARKSTVGCGDSVVAGLVYSLANGFDLKKTAMFSAACGSVTATKDGTNMCTLDEVNAFCNNIPIDRIEFL